MAQTNYTPIILYNSGTTGNTPSTSNLASGELAINYTDGKLFYKDNSSTLQVIGWKTTPTTAGGTGLTSYTAGDLPYYSSGSALSKLGIGTSGYVLQSNGSAPTWVAQSTLSVGTATNATNTAITDNTSSSATWYPTIVSATTGNLPQTTSSTKLSFVPSTGILTATGFAGAHNGTVGATTPSTGAFTTLSSSSDATLHTLTVGLGANSVSTNTTFGYQAMSTTSNGGNTAIGYQTIYNLTTQNNTAVGYGALYGASGGSGGGQNVAVGYNAGSTLNSNSSWTVMLGPNTQPNNGSDNTEIVLGTNPSATVTGKGGNTFFVYANNSGSSATGGSYFNGANSLSWSVTSDQSIKENVVTIASGLSVILQLNPVTFDYILTKQSDVGFIAQQYQTTLPNQVFEHDASPAEQELTNKTKLLGINQNLTPYLVKSIQELNATITTMQAALKAANIAGF